MNATPLLDREGDDDEDRDNGEREREASKEAQPVSPRLSPRRTVTAVDLRRRTSEIIAALERNEELMISYRDEWVGIMRPINLVDGFGYHPPLRRHRYFGYARRSPRLRRADDENELNRARLLNSDPKEEQTGTASDAGPEDDLLRLFDPPPGQIREKSSSDDE